MTMAPDDGWDSLPKAIARIAAELTKKHSQFVEKCGLKCDALVDTIPGWIDNDPARFPCHIKPHA